ncbi:MAG TPA: LLM class flavin-dependent oxidoreductase, partial [Chloroflexota bacterium]|nr:LLM class flavin-dependent oxidoreductase [Chloroflexota bacterium]
GWNPVEYEALGMSFTNRARRFEEQIALMRRLWTEPVVTFEGRYHRVSAAGLNPMPVQRPIPLWIGASAEAAVKRACAIADGYLPLRPLEGAVSSPGTRAAARVGAWAATVEKVHGWLRAAGRDPAGFGIEGRLDASAGAPDDWRKTAEMWRGLGASHLSVGTGGVGGPDAHIQRLREVREAVAS